MCCFCVQEVLLNIVRSGSNLLDVKNLEAWADLTAGEQLRLASGLLLALQENALLFAEVTAQPEILIESSYNICKFPATGVQTLGKGEGNRMLPSGGKI